MINYSFSYAGFGGCLADSFTINDLNYSLQRLEIDSLDVRLDGCPISSSTLSCQTTPEKAIYTGTSYQTYDVGLLSFTGSFTEITF